MRICIVYRADYHNGEPVPCYPLSYVDAFSALGHEVEMCGPGYPTTAPSMRPDLVLEIENGRHEDGRLHFRHHEFPFSCLSAVLLYDTHGYPEVHGTIAKSYHHVFFGSWCKRDVFAGHPSAHWCPSATDLKWFGTPEQLATEPTIDFGFFGSKRGLERAKDMVDICKANGWTYDVRQVGKPSNPNRWPETGNAMARCRVLFNRGQKRDSPNLRCIESMAMGRPLISNADPDSGMYLFEDSCDYLSYDSAGNLEYKMSILMKHENERVVLAESGRREVEAKHLVKHRAQQILEVVTQ